MEFGIRIVLFDLQLSSQLGDSELALRSRAGERQGPQYSLWFAWASVLQVDLFKKEKTGKKPWGTMRVPACGLLPRKASETHPFKGSFSLFFKAE